MDLIGGIFMLAVASLILTSICVGFIICGVIVLWRRDERKPKGMAGEENSTGPNVDTPQSAQMPQDSKDVQSQFAQLNKAVSGMARQLGEMHRWTQHGWLFNTGLCLVAVGLAVYSLAFALDATPQTVNLYLEILGILVSVVGWLLLVACLVLVVSNLWSRKSKLK